jgi:hypothetical protein
VHADTTQGGSGKAKKEATPKAKKEAVPKAKKDAAAPKATPTVSKEKAAGLSTILTKAEVEYMFDKMLENVEAFSNLVEEASRNAGVTQKRNASNVKRHWKTFVRTELLKLYKE